MYECMEGWKEVGKEGSSERVIRGLLVVSDCSMRRGIVIVACAVVCDSLVVIGDGAL